MPPSYLNKCVHPILYHKVFAPDYLLVIGDSAARDDAIPIRNPYLGHAQDSSLLAAEAIALLRSLSNMVEQPLPDRYLECTRFFDLKSGRASDSSDTALASSLDEFSQDVWFTTFERMLTILLSLPRCETPKTQISCIGVS